MEENNNENNNENTIDLEQFNQLKTQLSEVTSKLNEQIDINQKVSGKKEEILNELKTAKGKLSGFQQAAQDEEEKSLFGQGEEGLKIILDKRVKSATESYETDIRGLNSEKEQLLNQINELNNNIKVNEFSNKFLSILPQTEIAETAYEDVIELAMKNSEVQNGKVVFRDSNGNIQTLNSKGQEYSEFDFVNSLKHKTHLFKPQQGTDNKQGKFSTSGAEMTKKEAQAAQVNMTADEKAKFRKDIMSGKIQIN